VTPEDAALVVRRRMAMIDELMQCGEIICGHRAAGLLDLAVASPGLVVTFYIAAWEAIEAAEACDHLKADTKISVQAQVVQLLTIALDIVKSADPRVALLNMGATLAESLAMGDTDGGVH
jgi:hypothetical protein